MIKDLFEEKWFWIVLAILLILVIIFVPVVCKSVCLKDIGGRCFNDCSSMLGWFMDSVA